MFDFLRISKYQSPEIRCRYVAWSIMNHDIKHILFPVVIGLALLLPLVTHADGTTLPLSLGWNFISFQRLPSNPAPIEGVLGDVSANVRVVWEYNNKLKKWNNWKPGGTGNTLTEVGFGKGYWVYMNASGSIDMAGWLPPSFASVYLYDGWNLIGYNGANGTIIDTAPGNISGKWSTVWSWDSGRWYAKYAAIQALPSSVQPLSVFGQGKAYWIKVNQGQATDWTQVSMPIRGLYVQFEERGFPNGYWSGDAIQRFSTVDPVVGTTVADEIVLQLNRMREMGVNTITFELRTADPVADPGGFVPPTCNINPVLGLQWPNPTVVEIANLTAFFDLVQAKGMRLFLRLINTHMEEQPPTNSATWLGAILGAIKDHPALDLVVFDGDVHVRDTTGDGIADACGIPAEAPLWLGPTSVPGRYVKWAISYAQSLGIPARNLSAEAVIGDFFTISQAPAGSDATDGHLWNPIVTLKALFDDLQIPNDQRTYAVSFYEHRKCSTARNLPCVDADPDRWADQTLTGVFDTVGRGNGARVVAPEMGAMTPVEPTWSTAQALESLLLLMKQHGMDGGCFWRWTSFDNSEDSDTTLAQPIKRRGTAFTYNPVKDVLLLYYTTP